MNLSILLKIDEFNNLKLNISLSDYLNLNNVYDKNGSCVVLKEDRCVFNVLKSRNEGGKEDAALLNAF